LDPGSYWQEFTFHQHTPEDLEPAAQKAGLNISVLGQTGDFGYPRELQLCKNYMLKISPQVSASLPALSSDNMEEQ
jgi:hypothetical protein